MNATPETLRAQIEEWQVERTEAQSQPAVDMELVTELTHKIADAYGDLLAIAKSGVTL